MYYIAQIVNYKLEDVEFLTIDELAENILHYVPDAKILEHKEVIQDYPESYKPFLKRKEVTFLYEGSRPFHPDYEYLSYDDYNAAKLAFEFIDELI